MLKWALIFLVVALIAGALGFTGVAGAAMGIAKFLFFLFLVLFVAFLVMGMIAGRKITSGTAARSRTRSCSPIHFVNV